jgi:hypothetical protein
VRPTLPLLINNIHLHLSIAIVSSRLIDEEEN